MIFLPGDYRYVVLLATQLRFHDISVPLLGSNSWHTADLDRFRDRALTGSVFGDSFFADSPDPHTRDLVRRCLARYQALPTSFVVHAYEATHIVIDGLRFGARSGRQLRKYLDASENL